MNKYLVRLAGRILVILILISFALTPCIASAEEAEGTLSTRNLAMINKPGVVLVQTLWTADITLYEFSFLSEFEDDLLNAIASMVEDGTISNDENSMYSAMVQLMIENMKYYTFSTGNVYTETSSTAAVGTGFIVTPNGYLITNAHVVNTNEEELTYSFAMTALQNYAVEGTNAFVEEMRGMGYEMSQDEIDGMLYAFFDILSSNISIDNLQTSYSCYIGNVTPGSDVSAKGVGLDLRKVGEPIPGKDVAILKMDKTNLPTVTIGDDSKLRTGDKVYAMGYPAVATLDDALNVAQAIQEPTLTSGIISARKEMAGGWSILQTDADIHGGNSGGPLFNEDGEVIGINTFGMLDPDSGAQVAGMNFAVPISIALQFLNEINVTPSESSFTEKYKEAISLFDQEKYSESLEILRGLNETNPGYPVVADLLSEARTLADEQAKSQPESSDNAVTPGLKSADSPLTVGDSGLTEGSKEKETQDADAAEASGKNVKTEKGKSKLPIIPIAIAAGAVILIFLVVVIIIFATRKKPKQVIQNYGYMPPPPVPTNPVNPANPVNTVNPQNQVNPVNTVNTVNSAGSMIYCTNCGMAFPTGTKFCSSCGAKISENR